jgi:hypothetical protein
MDRPDPPIEPEEVVQPVHSSLFPSVPSFMTVAFALLADRALSA